MATSGARRDQILEDLLAKDNFSQALKHLNKKLKKQPKSTDNLVTKIFVLQRTGDIQGAIEICEALVNSKPPITDLNQLFQIHQNLANLERIDKVTSCAKLAVTLWKNSINVQRNASERVLIAKKWAQNAITFSQWAQVQQIVAYYLSSRTDPGSQSAGIQSAIACRMADQSVKDMPEIIDAVLKTPGKHVSSRSELELFMLTSGKSQPGKAIDLLEQKSLGPSKVPTNDKWGALGLNRLLLSESERRVELRKMSRETLDNAQKTRNEWKQQDLALWKDTIVKGSGTDEELARGEAIDFAANAVKADAGARPASLVLMELLHDQFSQKEVFEESSDYSTFKLAFQAHVKALITSPVFESDLLALLEEWRKRGFQPPAEIRNIIRDEAEQVSAGAKASSPTEQLKWITAEANSLSCDLQHYEIQWKQDSSVWPTVGDSSESTSHLQIPLRHKPKQLPAEISTFVASCIKLYKVARAHTAKLPKFDPDPGDKALLLAARALSWAGEISRHQNFRILGTCLLQFLVEESEYNSKARMMLISRLQALGLHSLAAETYSNLRVKGVLFESCAPLFFTRISVYHPKPTRNFKPYEETTKALKFYADSLTATGNFQGASLDEKNYGSVIKMQELRDQLQNSATRQLLCLERRRISRMTGTPLKDEGLLFAYQLEEQPRCGICRQSTIDNQGMAEL
ncbi:hypothetical protein FH972_021520 [Carpinus fangiana]|uniref:Uncharacterized protein n=1 Tax=Carpinus fangiana TaxID=176857 RepID=A0A5N6KPJ5_9ROSI|nr:hypothetical protein FH972_021520 [Carpinus fangiana]